MKNISRLFLFLSLTWLAVAIGCRSNDSSAGSGKANEGDSHFARFGTNQVHYRIFGKGSKTLVFIHGWSCDGTIWREQVSAFSDRARLVMIDLPGHGRSSKPQTNYSMAFFANAVAAVMKDAGINKASLIGHSMGVPVIC